VSAALNFENDGVYVVGGCDLYTTKAASADKKLYKKIDNELEAQHESLLRLAASLSPPHAKQFASSQNLSRSSPFGTLSQISNRRTFAYLIATLNASHPDYDFSHILRPSDFRRERKLQPVMTTIEEKVYSAHSKACRTTSGAQTPGGSTMWSPAMWRIVDEEMDLENCSIYSYRPEENPFDDEDTALWSLHYFFFNKQKKRVCYIYLRALKISWYDLTGGNSDYFTEPTTPKRKHSLRSSMDFGARKRARYWLGERANDVEGGYADEDEVEVIKAPGDDEVDADIDIDYIDDMIRSGRSLSPISVSSDDDDELHIISSRERRKSHVRAHSEGVAESIEV
jgi:hypothetical protein